MNRPGRRRLLVLDLRRSWARLCLAGLGIVIATALLTFLLGLGQGVRRGVIGKMVPADRLEVARKGTHLDLGPLRMGLGSDVLDDVDLDRLASIRGVGGVFPKVGLAAPAVATGGASLLGQSMVTEVVIDGIDPLLVADDVTGDLEFAARPIPVPGALRCVLDEDCGPGLFCVDAPGIRGVCRPPAPVVVARNLVELYNGTVRRAYDLPKLNPDAIIGLGASVRFGGSSFTAVSRGTVLRDRVQLVGFSDRAAPLGLTLPIEEVQRLNEAFGDGDRGGGYDTAVLVLTRASDLGRVAGAVRAAGYRVVDRGTERAAAVMGVAMLVLALVGGAVVLVAALGVLHTFSLLVEGRRREVAVLRAVGASAIDVVLLFLTEAAIVGILSGLIGAVVGTLFARVADVAAMRSLRQLPFVPDSLFAIGPGLVIAVVVIAAASAVIGAAGPVFRAVRRPPAEML